MQSSGWGSIHLRFLLAPTTSETSLEGIAWKLEENKVDREEESLGVSENQRQEDRREQEGEVGEVE